MTRDLLARNAFVAQHRRNRADIGIVFVLGHTAPDWIPLLPKDCAHLWPVLLCLPLRAIACHWFTPSSQALPGLQTLCRFDREIRQHAVGASAFEAEK